MSIEIDSLNPGICKNCGANVICRDTNSLCIQCGRESDIKADKEFLKKIEQDLK